MVAWIIKMGIKSMTTAMAIFLTSLTKRLYNEKPVWAKNALNNKASLSPGEIFKLGGCRI